MNHHDLLQPFVFEDSPIRGSIAHLNSTYHMALAHQTLPLVIKRALGQLMAASALLTASLKMEGAMIIQVQTTGQLKLLVVECDANLTMRATAKWDGEIADDADFLALIEGGQFVITLATEGHKPYQGIVPVEGDSIASMLEHYMTHSQQIDTKLWLSCNDQHASGLMLQKLPEDVLPDADAWHRVVTLADTITDDELVINDAQRIITKLFHEEDVRIFDDRLIRFYCKCTRANVANMLQMLGKDEVESIINDETQVTVNCGYCNKAYLFDAVDVASLFTGGEVAAASKAIH